MHRNLLCKSKYGNFIPHRSILHLHSCKCSSEWFLQLFRRLCIIAVLQYHYYYYYYIHTCTQRETSITQVACRQVQLSLLDCTSSKQWKRKQPVTVFILRAKCGHESLFVTRDHFKTPASMVNRRCHAGICVLMLIFTIISPMWITQSVLIDSGI